MEEVVKGFDPDYSPAAEAAKAAAAATAPASGDAAAVSPAAPGAAAAAGSSPSATPGSESASPVAAPADQSASPSTSSSSAASAAAAVSGSGAAAAPPASKAGRKIPVGHMGALFKTFVPFLKMYTQYVNNHEGASRTLNEMIVKKRKKFVPFCETAGADPRCKGNALQSLLIMPVQRVPRYKLLLQELIKNFEEDHPDHATLLSAYADTDKVAAHINEALRRQQNQADLMSLQAQFTHKVALVQPDRILVFQGASGVPTTLLSLVFSANRPPFAHLPPSPSPYSPPTRPRRPCGQARAQ